MRLSETEERQMERNRLIYVGLMVVIAFPLRSWEALLSISAPQDLQDLRLRRRLDRQLAWLDLGRSPSLRPWSQAAERPTGRPSRPAGQFENTVTGLWVCSLNQLRRPWRKKRRYHVAVVRFCRITHGIPGRCRLCEGSTVLSAPKSLKMNLSG